MKLFIAATTVLATATANAQLLKSLTGSSSTTAQVEEYVKIRPASKEDAARFKVLTEGSLTQQSIGARNKTLLTVDGAESKLSSRTRLNAAGILNVDVSLKLGITLPAGQICPQLRKDVAEVNDIVRRIAPRCVDLKKTIESTKQILDSQSFVFNEVEKKYNEAVALASDEAKKALQGSKAAVDYAVTRAELGDLRLKKAIADTNVQVEAALELEAKLRLDIAMKVCLSSYATVAVNESEVKSRMDACAKLDVSVNAAAEVDVHAKLKIAGIGDSAALQKQISQKEAELSAAEGKLNAYVDSEMSRRKSQLSNLKIVMDQAKSAKSIAQTSYDKAVADLKKFDAMGQCPNYVPRVVNYVCDKYGF